MDIKILTFRERLQLAWMAFRYPQFVYYAVIHEKEQLEFQDRRERVEKYYQENKTIKIFKS